MALHVNKLPKVGSRNGDWILKERKRNRNGTYTDTWVLDPVVTLTPNMATNKAYKWGAGNAASAITSPDAATVEFTDADYAYIGTEDGVFVMSSGRTTVLSKYSNVAHRFTFDTSLYANITDITCIWKGYRAGDPPDVGKLQVYKATAWEDWLTSLPTTNTKYTKSLGNGLGYFYNSTWIRFGLYMTAQFLGDTSLTLTIYSDYAALQITYVVAVARGDGFTWIVG